MGMGWREWEGEMFIKVSIFYNIIINIYINNYIIKSIEAVLDILKMYLHICTFAQMHTKLLTRGANFLAPDSGKDFLWAEFLASDLRDVFLGSGFHASDSRGDFPGSEFYG